MKTIKKLFVFTFITFLFFQEKKLIAQTDNKIKENIPLKSRDFQQFEVSFKENHFCLVDKNGIEIKKFGKWKEITEEDYVAFDFLKVKDNFDTKYLLDSDGNKYLFAESLEKFTPQTEALEIRNQHLGKFPKEIFEIGKNLVFLCVDGTGIYEIPKEIRHLKNLKYLDISNNPIFELPEEMNKLEFLEKIDI
jgi:Leucine-rich repeat (LRR) protein